jgi:hypothetical protein
LAGESKNVSFLLSSNQGSYLNDIDTLILNIHALDKKIVAPDNLTCIPEIITAPLYYYLLSEI